jgi:hypothetical protein
MHQSARPTDRSPCMRQLIGGLPPASGWYKQLYLLASSTHFLLCRGSSDVGTALQWMRSEPYGSPRRPLIRSGCRGPVSAQPSVSRVAGGPHACWRGLVVVHKNLFFLSQMIRYNLSLKYYASQEHTLSVLKLLLSRLTTHFIQNKISIM